MSTIRFACTSLVGTKKAGILPADSDGYVTMPVGGLNIFNSAGQWYDYEGAKQLFEQSSVFMRKVKRGVLKGEVGHPRQERGQSMDEFISRVYQIMETNVCVHFKEIFLDFNSMKDDNGKPVIAIMGKLKASGPQGDFLDKALKNQSENVCFSIRSLTKDYLNKGIYTREIKDIVTFDYVSEPGISLAEKFKSPSLESFIDSPITRNQVERAISKQSSIVGCESSLMNPSELFASLGWELPKGSPPPFSNW